MTGLDREEIDRVFNRVAARVDSGHVATSSVAIESLPGRPGVFAGVGPDQSWSLVVEAESMRGHHPSIRLELLSAEFDVWYTLSTGVDRRSRVSVVTCRSGDSVIRGLFVSVVCEMLGRLPAKPSTTELAMEVDRWLTLFRRLHLPSRNDVVGLIGELTVLRQAKDKELWVDAWHRDPTDLLDFNFPGLGISVEVKATRANERRHHIGLNQAIGGVGGARLFASVLVELRGGGAKIGDVASEVAAHLTSATSRQQFWEVMAMSCGTDLPAMLKQEFVLSHSVDSLRLYRVEDIPQPNVRIPLPPGVSDVRFESNFGASPSVLLSAVPGFR